MQVGTAGELEVAVWTAWDTCPATFVPSLYGSMAHQLTAIQVTKGAATSRGQAVVTEHCSLQWCELFALPTCSMAYFQRGWRE